MQKPQVRDSQDVVAIAKRRATVQVAALPRGARIEIDAIARKRS
jgi:enamine deaminase RidA (YjgF/YER057c/UK114 family)